MVAALTLQPEIADIVESDDGCMTDCTVLTIAFVTAPLQDTFKKAPAGGTVRATIDVMTVEDCGTTVVEPLVVADGVKAAENEDDGDDNTL